MLLSRNRVLIVDDETAFRRTLRTSLTACGFTVEEARSGEEALSTLSQNRFDLVLLDINMPGICGIDACEKIHGMSPESGIVMLTVREQEEYKVRALEAGADDYVTKPFKLRELAARLKALRRRLGARENQVLSVLEVGALKMDVGRRLLWRDGQEIRLTPKEFDLLAFMMKNVGAPLTHIKLLRSVWGLEYGNESEYLRTYVRMLRRKIEKDPAQPEYIVTETRIGYRFRDPLDPDSPWVSSEDEC